MGIEQGEFTPTRDARHNFQFEDEQRAAGREIVMSSGKRFYNVYDPKTRLEEYYLNWAGIYKNSQQQPLRLGMPGPGRNAGLYRDIYSQLYLYDTPGFQREDVVTIAQAVGLVYTVQKALGWERNSNNPIHEMLYQAKINLAFPNKRSDPTTAKFIKQLVQLLALKDDQLKKIISAKDNPRMLATRLMQAAFENYKTDPHLYDHERHPRVYELQNGILFVSYTEEKRLDSAPDFNKDTSSARMVFVEKDGTLHTQDVERLLTQGDRMKIKIQDTREIVASARNTLNNRKMSNPKYGKYGRTPFGGAWSREDLQTQHRTDDPRMSARANDNGSATAETEGYILPVSHKVPLDELRKVSDYWTSLINGINPLSEIIISAEDTVFREYVAQDPLLFGIEELTREIHPGNIEGLHSIADIVRGLQQKIMDDINQRNVLPFNVVGNAIHPGYQEVLKGIALDRFTIPIDYDDKDGRGKTYKDLKPEVKRSVDRRILFVPINSMPFGQILIADFAFGLDGGLKTSALTLQPASYTDISQDSESMSHVSGSTLTFYQDGTNDIYPLRYRPGEFDLRGAVIRVVFIPSGVLSSNKRQKGSESPRVVEDLFRRFFTGGLETSHIVKIKPPEPRSNRKENEKEEWVI